MNNGSPGKMTFGLIVGNRGFFPNHLAQSGRAEMIAAIEAAGHGVVALSPEETKYGAVTTRADVAACADLFQKNRDRSTASSSRCRISARSAPSPSRAPGRAERAGAGPGHPGHSRPHDHRGPPRQLLRQDVVLQQPEAVRHPVFADHAAHRSAGFGLLPGGPRMVRGGLPRACAACGDCASAPSARGRRRSTPCATARRCWKRTASPSSRSTSPRSSAASTAWAIKTPRPQAKLDQIRRYVPPTAFPRRAAEDGQARRGHRRTGCRRPRSAVSAVQCWTSMEEYFGVVPCTVMSMMSNDLMSSACEVDICGVDRHARAALASGTPSALLDWNNNYGDDPDKAVCFHCSNLPKHFFKDDAHGLPGDHRRHGGQREHLRHLRGPREGGADELRALLHRRLRGQDRGYVGEGEFTDDPLETFGGAGVVRIPRHAGPAALHLRERASSTTWRPTLRAWPRRSTRRRTRYLGWDMYWHS